MTQRLSKTGFRGAGRMVAISLGIAAALALPLSASASEHGHGGGHYGGGYDGGSHGGYGGYGGNHGDYGRHGGGYYGNRGHSNVGGWIAGALVTGAVIGLVNNALRPSPVYHDQRVAYRQPVTYSQSGTVIYTDDYPVVTRRVVERRTVIYDDQSNTRYIRDDGYDHDDGYDD